MAARYLVLDSPAQALDSPAQALASSRLQATVSSRAQALVNSPWVSDNPQTMANRHQLHLASNQPSLRLTGVQTQPSQHCNLPRATIHSVQPDSPVQQREHQLLPLPTMQLCRTCRWTPPPRPYYSRSNNKCLRAWVCCSHYPQWTQAQEQLQAKRLPIRSLRISISLIH